MPPDILLILTGIVFAFVLVRRFFLEKAQPARLEMAEVGKELLSSPKLTEQHKLLVADMLDDAYDWRYMISACLALPAVAINWAIHRKHPDRGFDVLLSDEKFKTFMQLHRKATSAANPLFAVIFNLEMTLLFLVFFSLFAVGKVQLLALLTVQKTTPLFHHNRSHFNNA